MEKLKKALDIKPVKVPEEGEEFEKGRYVLTFSCPEG